MSSIYVSPDSNLADNFREAIANFSEAENRPIRVLFGRFRTLPPGPWTEEQIEACGTDSETAESRGLTVIDWGAATASYGREWEALPGAFYLDNIERALDVKDVLLPQENVPAQAIPYKIGNLDDGTEFTVGEFRERKTWFYLNLGYIPNPEEVDVQTFAYRTVAAGAGRA
jgi:hypothetical protein